MSKRERSTKKNIVLAGLGLLLVGYLGFSSYAVLALFTDTESVAPNNFTTGTLDLVANPDGVNVPFNVTGMAPGDTVNGAITVQNAGTMELRYAVTSTTTEDVLAAQLDMIVSIEATEAACLTTPVGAPIYGPFDLGSTGTTNTLGDPTVGPDAGDRVLAAGGSEVLCFQVTLPLLTTDNSFQGVATTADFTFLAEQTANNP